jgi:hypothetical protein
MTSNSDADSERSVEAPSSEPPLQLSQNANKHLINGGHFWPTIRNLYAVGTLFEKQINTVFPTNRVSRMSESARPTSHKFRKFCDVRGALAVIQDSSHVGDLVNKAKIPRAVAYNPNAMYRTIEFRQHHGTVNPEAACSWAQFVCGLIRAAHAAGDARFPASFLDRPKKEGFDFLALLTALNMDSLKECYGEARRPHGATGPSPMGDSLGSLQSRLDGAVCGA